jgi:hypothetical protein
MAEFKYFQPRGFTYLTIIELQMYNKVQIRIIVVYEKTALTSHVSCL